MSDSREELTRALAGAQTGDPEAVERLYRAAYSELRRIARAHRRSKPNQTLNTTALVNEAYVKLFEKEPPGFKNRAHFFAVSARAMRQILVDHFRARISQKRGGGSDLLNLDGELVPDQQRGDLILAVHDALETLATQEPRLAQVVEYKFFGGMTQDEIAGALGLSPRTVSNDWRLARAWLAQELTPATEGAS